MCIVFFLGLLILLCYCFRLRESKTLLPNMINTHRIMLYSQCSQKCWCEKGEERKGKGITGGEGVVATVFSKSRERYVACVIDGTASTQSIASISLRPHMCCLRFLLGGKLDWHRAEIVFLLMSFIQRLVHIQNIFSIYHTMKHLACIYSVKLRL